MNIIVRNGGLVLWYGICYGNLFRAKNNNLCVKCLEEVKTKQKNNSSGLGFEMPHWFDVSVEEKKMDLSVSISGVPEGSF